MPKVKKDKDKEKVSFRVCVYIFNAFNTTGK